MNNLKKDALDLHKTLKGKIEIRNKVSDVSQESLSLLYSPGVAEPCLEIEETPHKVYDYTWKGNTVAVVSNGTAVLGLGDIGAAAGLPVMEGKAFLFKEFAGVNAIPLVLDTKDTDELIRTVEILSPTFGGINLEDIKAPECFIIEDALKEKLDIPVFHDDQHGTAIVVMAGLINAYKLLGKDLKEAKVVVSGTGAAGCSIIRMLYDYGIRSIKATNSKGIIDPKQKEKYNEAVQRIIPYLSDINDEKTLSDGMCGADVFIGVSAANIVSKEDVSSMNRNAIVFGLANPNPEIPYDDAIEAGARIVGTGRSDYPNQVNNVLAFPGIFKGALSVEASEITESMKLAAAYGIASMVKDNEISETNILPLAINRDVADVVAEAVAEEAIRAGVARKHE
ncbi:NADP-dependent malic enzyme [Erysipelothrix sp. HDW6A]|uniref:NAD(P)-dependent malic enzyme n=1 Tax=Erysipelothrix sp. HDW6A TaxID=2714928 RepID=UPI001408E472|nr:NADP-dependent malic enzyme [Erysipelothrix sp. HDW6A]QIK56490.1 NADP-dependent malic enzyme [Erysipelothrix sp. HDW6A]